MRVLLGTKTGLAEIDDDNLQWLVKGDVSRLHAGWAVVDGSTLVDLGDPQRMITPPFAPQCLASVDDTLIVGTAESHLLAVKPGARGAARVASFDEIPTRDQWYTPWGGPPDTRSIAVTTDGTPLVNVHVGGVWRGEGRQWSEVIAVDDDTHQVLASTDDADTVVVAAAVGFAQSHDGGRTFSFTDDGLHAAYCRAVAITEDNVLVTASTGPFTEHGAVYMRALHSTGPFIRCDNGLPEWFEGNIDTFQLAAVGPTAVIGTEGGDVFLSEDAGTSWELVADDFDPIRCVAIVP